MEVGIFEAKTYLSSLLERVKKGESIVIKKRGKAIVCLVPIQKIYSFNLDQKRQALFHSRKTMKLNHMKWKELRDKGRK